MFAKLFAKHFFGLAIVMWPGHLLAQSAPVRTIEFLLAHHRNASFAVEINGIPIDTYNSSGSSSSATVPLLTYLMPGPNVVRVKNLEILDRTNFGLDVAVYRSPENGFPSEGRKIASIVVDNQPTDKPNPLIMQFRVPKNYTTLLATLPELTKNDQSQATSILKRIYAAYQKKDLSSVLPHFDCSHLLLAQHYPAFGDTSKIHKDWLAGYERRSKRDQFVGAWPDEVKYAPAAGRRLLVVSSPEILAFRSNRPHSPSSYDFQPVFGKLDGKIQLCFM